MSILSDQQKIRLARWLGREERILVTNDLGLARFAVGTIYERDGQRWFITKSKPTRDGWGGIGIYGVWKGQA